MRVHAKIGTTSWDTSLFPTKEKVYLIAIKVSVRKKEGLDEGDTVRLEFSLL